MAAILVVEDNALLGSVLCQRLQQLGLPADRVTTQAAALTCLQHRLYDLVVLDRLLPDGDGLELIATIVEKNLPTKTLIMSVKGTVSERVLGLAAGAHDYLPKPFDWQECLWRIKRLLSTSTPLSHSVWQVGQARFFPESGLLEVNERRQQLRRRETQVLRCFYRYRNQIVSRDRLVSEVWGESELQPSDVTIEVYVRRLRMKLGNSATALQTVRGMGYVLRDDSGQG